MPLIEVKRATLQQSQQLATRSNYIHLREGHRTLQQDTRRCANSYCFDLCGNMEIAADSKTSVACTPASRQQLGPQRARWHPSRTWKETSSRIRISSRGGGMNTMAPALKSYDPDIELINQLPQSSVLLSWTQYRQ